MHQVTPLKHSAMGGMSLSDELAYCPGPSEEAY